MRFYEILIAHQSYHGTAALTYSHDERLLVGQLVRISLRNRSTLGVVLKEVSQPTFQVKPLAAVAPFQPLPTQSLELMRWIQAYYPAPFGAVVRLFVPASEVFPSLKRQEKTAEATLDAINTITAEAPELTTDQNNALETIQGPGTFMLHGITGSGKSRVYVELARRAVQSGKSALVLTPEIGLTAQLTATFRRAVGVQVYVLHSQLTAAERRDIWFAILSETKPIVVLGPRSALFAPIHDIGVIIVDEAHDNAYKNESAPHYHANRVAARLATFHKASVVLGSATPRVEDYYLAEQKQRPIVPMQSLATSSDHKLSVKIVDLRDPAAFSRNRLLSTILIEQISASLGRGEQALLFLNRRGTANVVLCSSCGWQSICPHCDVSLTYHGDEHLLRCHICGYHSILPTVCPTCGNDEILFKSIGTKAVVDAVQKLFPTARLQRFDTDAKRDERLEHHIEALAGGSADIIIGTQMVSKGLDLPKLSVVGIINADSSLLIPDYSANEQTYQIIRQVIGRVGRGHLPGTVVVQTYNPDNAVLLAALHHDWQGFYKTELAERRSYHFPPFVYLLKLRVLRATSKSAEAAANKLATLLAQNYPACSIEGPVASFHPKENSKYSWQLLIKASSRTILTEIIIALPSGWTYDIDPTNLL